MHCHLFIVVVRSSLDGIAKLPSIGHSAINTNKSYEDFLIPICKLPFGFPYLLHLIAISTGLVPRVGLSVSNVTAILEIVLKATNDGLVPSETSYTKG